MAKLKISGVIPFEDFKDKLKKINQLKKEFENKVRITVEDGFIFYDHYYQSH